jgi:hypothetical protein
MALCVDVSLSPTSGFDDPRYRSGLQLMRQSAGKHLSRAGPLPAHMKLILFLGSGVSVPSGLPTADQLTRSIFLRAYHQDGHFHFSRGSRPKSVALHADDTSRIRHLLKLLRDYDRHDRKRIGHARSGRFSSGALFRGPNTTYEDIYHLSRQMASWSSGLADTSFVTPLMDIIQRKAGTLLAPCSALSRMSELGCLAERACAFIECAVADALRAPRILGLDLILQLADAPFIEDLTIITLNHDCLVEDLFSQNNISLKDGFGASDGDVRWYDDGNYDVHHIKATLLKLHGSINWYQFTPGSRRAIFNGVATAHIKDGKGNRLTPIFDRPSFLSGMSKAVQYYRGIYADVHFRFQKALRESDVIVMSGYGWGDVAITFQLEAWLDRNSSNRIVHLHKNPDSIKEKSLTFESARDYWTNGRQLILVHRWLSEVTLDELIEYL